MHEANVEYIASKITVLIVNALRVEDESCNLKPLTNAHRDAWVRAAQQLIKKIEEGIKVAEETDYDKLHL
jgi:hypothetical protein